MDTSSTKLDEKMKPDANPISKKVSKILDSKVETDKEMIDALQTVSTFFGENTLHNRRNLRRDIEKRSLQVNLEFLEQFKKVKEELDKVSNCVSAMNECCSTMTQRLQSTKAQTRDLINETTKLQMESKRVDKRAEISNAFLAVFQLKADEIKALKGTSDGGITKDFFDALNRAKEIHTDCKQLLHGGQHIAGLEIMDAMAAHQESAYELLYRWIQRECRLFNIDLSEVNPLVCKAFHALENRPVLFKYSLDEFCTARRNYIVRAFIDALTKGGPGGVPKPIELLSHDPLRYVNDMLAWIHQSLASEKEFLQSLLKECSEETVSQNIQTALSQITDGLYRPFKVRVEQVLGGENGPVLLYKLSNLFRFYYNTIKVSLIETASFLYAVNELRELLTNVFHSSLNTNVHRLLEKVEQPGPELMPVQGLNKVLLLLRDVLESHDSVLVPVSDKKENFSKIFGSVLDPLLTTLVLTSTHLNPIDLAVYMLNCLHSIISMLSLYEYTDERLEMLQAQVEVQVNVLLSEQASYILTRTGMIRVYNFFLQHQPNQGPASKLPNLSAEIVKGAVDKFDLFLASPDSYKLAQCRMLASPKIKEMVHNGTMIAIVNAYKVIYDKTVDQQNLYKEPFMIVGKSVDQIKELLM